LLCQQPRKSNIAAPPAPAASKPGHAHRGQRFFFWFTSVTLLDRLWRCLYFVRRIRFWSDVLAVARKLALEWRGRAREF
jgi:hypothetical protein